MCSVKTLTIFRKEKKMKTIKMLTILVLALGLIASVANADFTFGTPTNLGPNVNSSARDENPGISADGLWFYYCSLRSGGYGNYDLWLTRRATAEDDWGTPANLGPTVNSSSHDFSPDVSADGLMLYFASDRPGGYGSYDLWVMSRATTEEDWGTPVNLGPTVNSSAQDGCPAISDDGLELYFWSNRPGGSGGTDLWIATRATIEDDWAAPVNLGPTVNSSAGEVCSDISGDGLSLFFVSGRSGGYGGGDIWVTTRPTISGPWGTPVNLGPMVNSSALDNGPVLSADGSTFYFSSDRPGGFGGFDICQVSIEPVVDFNGDGKVDVKDVVIMTEHWGENYSLCDIGPTPLGDGIVDVQDLVVLTEYMEPKDRTLIAHWALDETEGIIAQDNSAGDNDAYLIGDPIWQPSGGQVDGALQLDGVDDCVITGSIPNPAEGPFSVFAWVKDGAPDQAVLSQMGGARWLCTDPSEGNLMTELKGTGRGAAELLSQTIITNGNWHRIGLVWDGSHRTLYVDDVAVAEDAQTDLEASENGLYIGAGTAMEPGSFWSGLIDDVRIYNRAVTP